MRLPFTIDQFLEVFRRYNFAVWPSQWLLLTLALIAAGLALNGHRNTDRWVSSMLAVLWLWMAVVYHVMFFASINRAALLFAAAFALEGVLFAWVALRRPSVTYWPQSNGAAVLGALMFLYALLVYPTIGYAVGHRYPAAPTFGVPCPTTIFTLALMVWAGRSLPRRLLIVPLAWCVVGTSAAVSLGMVEDFGLPIAAIAALIWLPLGHRAESRRFSSATPVRPT